MTENKKQRLEGRTITCPIIYGSISYWMGKKADEYATHKWTLFVRGPNDEDLSVFISKIIFSLHPSFSIPVREITSPPFEVTEMGWGEFEAGIRIYFTDPNEKYIDILHPIKLYPGGGQQLTMKKPVMHEFYDEIVFTDPSPEFFADLMRYTPPLPEKRPITHLSEYYTIFDENADLQHLLTIQHHLKAQIEASKTQLLQLEGEIAYYNTGNRATNGNIPSLPPPSSSGSGSSSTTGNGNSSTNGTSGSNQHAGNNGNTTTHVKPVRKHSQTQQGVLPNQLTQLANNIISMNEQLNNANNANNNNHSNINASVN